MKLKLRIGRQRAQDSSTDEARTGSGLADRARELPPVVPAAPPAAAPARVPVPRMTERRVVRVGTFCPARDVGQTAVTETQRAVVAVRAGRCGRWVYA
jgi:hypothetical protein